VADPPAPGSLQRELRQTRPFRTLGQEAYVALLRTADQAKYQFAGLFQTQQLTLQQYNVLRILRGAGEKGLPTLEIGERMIERTPGVTRIVDRLERKGWVNRDRGVEDRRRVWCTITPSGLELLAALDDPVDDLDEAIFEVLDDHEVQTLVDILATLRARMSAMEKERG